MSKIAITFGVALILVGIGGFLPSHAPTSLIPAYLGFVIGLCGVLAMNPKYRMHAMHIAVLAALLGAIAAGGRLAISLTKPEINSLAVSSQSITTVLCAVFVVLCVRSFIAARRARQAALQA